jgi:DNA-binding NtrC family response regulator
LKHESVAFTNPLDALRDFEDRPDYYQLAIVDFNMPHMDGMRLSQEVLRIRPAFPVVIATGFSASLTESKALEMGVRAYMSKPYSRKMLAETLHRVMLPVR